MTCDESRRWLDAYFDGELDLTRSVELEEHLRGCATCARARDNLMALRKPLAAARFDAPEPLRQRVRAAVRREMGGEPPAGQWSLSAILRWLIPAAAIAALVLIAGQAEFGSGAERRTLDEITDSHVRSLVGTHLVDVVSSDQHTVRPWFEGRVDFAPPVPDLSTHGFEIIGGRLDYIDGHSAGALVYQVRKHYISVIIQLSPRGANAPATEIGSKPSQRGYNVFAWSHGGLDYWAVSEISPDELHGFAEDFLQESAGR
jgi:anti-sigma factor RsiW